MLDQPQLTIGGVTLLCQGDEVTHMSRGARRLPRQRRSKAKERTDLVESGSEVDSDAALQDFLDNMMEHDEGRDAEDQLAATVNMLRARMGPDAELSDDALYPGLEQIDPRDLERTISGSDDSSSDVYDSDPTTDINSDLASGTPAAATPLPQAMWPFKPSGRRRQSRAAVKGADGGRLALGEKARLKRERVLAQRSARAAKSGADLQRISQELQDFVMAGGDLKAFAPMSTYAMSRTQKMASLYGLKSSQQGSGKRRFVLVAATERMAVPEGEAWQALQDMIAFQHSAVAAARPSRRSTQPGSSAPAAPRSQGKQALAQGSGRATGRSWGLQYQQPVGFVASGVQMEDGEVVQLLSRSMARTSLADDAAMPDAAPSEGPADIGAESARAGLGLGAAQPMMSAPFMTASSGLGFASLSSLPTSSSGGFGPVVTQPPAAATQVSGDPVIGVEEAGPAPVVPNILTTRKQHRNALKKQEKLARRGQRASSQAPAAPAPQLDAAGTNMAYGQFEQHTTGFGSRMLAKWGFEGQGSGLGREGQGRAEPLSASMRPKQLGLGSRPSKQ